MRLDRWIALPALLAALLVAGCGSGVDRAAQPQTTYDYVTAVRPLAYENAHAACSGHSLASLAYEYGTSGSTFENAARDWAHRNQPDVRVRREAFLGCRDALRETARRPVQIARPSLTQEEIEIYILQYSTCVGLTVADLATEYGLDIRGLTVAQAVLAVVRKTYGPAYRQVAYGACLAAVRGEPPRYGS